MLERDILHPREARDPQAVSFGQLAPELFRINFNGAQTAKPAKTQDPARDTAREGGLSRFVQLRHALLHHKVFEATPQRRMEPFARQGLKGPRNGRVGANASENISPT